MLRSARSILPLDGAMALMHSAQAPVLGFPGERFHSIDAALASGSGGHQGRSAFFGGCDRAGDEPAHRS